MAGLALQGAASGQVRAAARAKTVKTAGAARPRLVFAGDLLLARQVAREVQLTRRPPLAGLRRQLRGAVVAGNLEGALGSSRECVQASSPADRGPCFAVNPQLAVLLRRAGFTQVGVENNHAGDLGPEGRRRTSAALRADGLGVWDYSGSPHFMRVGSRIIAIIAITTVPEKDGRRVSIPSIALRQKLRLARSLANLTVVYVHWGTELQDWPNAEQESAARWLIAHGAGVVIGMHPHVIQRPECVRGHAVFFSLGNTLFDQKYRESKRGLLAICRIQNDELACRAERTLTADGDFFPHDDGPDAASNQVLRSCAVHLHPTLRIGGISLRPWIRSSQTEDNRRLVVEGWRAGRLLWRARPRDEISLAPAHFFGASQAPALLSLERHRSIMDDEDAIRPYVYQVTRRGLVARWRGTALAWPLLDAVPVESTKGNGSVQNAASLLCALHRKDSFLLLQPDSKGTRVAAYRWSGFGFQGVEAKLALQACQGVFPN